MQTQKVRGVATSVRHEGTRTIVRYHSTDVVSFDGESVTLNSGGWHTATTKTRMMQASNEFNLGFTVYQRKFAWYVVDGNGDTHDFADGMTIPRRARYWSAERGAWIAAGKDA